MALLQSHRRFGFFVFIEMLYEWLNMAWKFRLKAGPDFETYLLK